MQTPPTLGESGQRSEHAPMRILLMETPPVDVQPSDRAGWTSPVAALLAAEGAVLVRCAEMSQEPFPCAGLTGRCPLASGPIDVAVIVRPDADAAAGPAELGVRCALEHRVPVVVASAGGTPYGSYADAHVHPDHVADAVRSVSQEPSSQHGLVGMRAAAEALDARGVRGTVEVSVRRRGGGLDADVTFSGAAPLTLTTFLADRVRIALRRFDPHARWIDVSVRATRPPE